MELEANAVERLIRASPDQVARKWQSELGVKYCGHLKASAFYWKCARVFSILATVGSAAVGTAIFVSLTQSPSTLIKIIASAVSVLVAILSALNHMFSASALADQHKRAATIIGAQMRYMDVQLASKCTREDLCHMKERLNANANEIPVLSHWFYWRGKMESHKFEREWYKTLEADEQPPSQE